MTRICYLPDAREEENAPSETILQTSIRAGVPHTHACGGNARCSTCRVLILEGLQHCAEPNDRELVLAEKMNFTPNIRLACQTRISSDVKLRRLVLDREDAEMASKLAASSSMCSVGEEKRLAILFSDIRGFTSFSEKMLPYDVVHLLNRYFHRMGKIIADNGGYIDNYIGDGLLALFGVKSEDGAAFNAVKAGLEMLDALEDLNRYFIPLYNWRVDIGVGIHFGDAVIGTIGAADSKRETAIGDSVNFASRIESVNKELSTRLLVSEDVYRQVRDRVQTGKQEHIKIKGKTGKYALYEILSVNA